MNPPLEEVFGILSDSYIGSIQSLKPKNACAGVYLTNEILSCEDGFRLQHESVLIYLTELLKADQDFACRLVLICSRLTEENSSVIFSDSAISSYFEQCTKYLKENRYRYESKATLMSKYKHDPPLLEKHLQMHKSANNNIDIEDVPLNKLLTKINSDCVAKITTTMKMCEALTKSITRNTVTWKLVVKFRELNAADPASSALNFINQFKVSSACHINNAQFASLSTEDFELIQLGKTILSQAKHSQKNAATKKNTNQKNTTAPRRSSSTEPVRSRSTTKPNRTIETLKSAVPALSLKALPQRSSSTEPVRSRSEKTSIKLQRSLEPLKSADATFQQVASVAQLSYGVYFENGGEYKELSNPTKAEALAMNAKVIEEFHKKRRICFSLSHGEVTNGCPDPVSVYRNAIALDKANFKDSLINQSEFTPYNKKYTQGNDTKRKFLSRQSRSDNPVEVVETIHLIRAIVTFGKKLLLMDPDAVACEAGGDEGYTYIDKEFGLHGQMRHRDFNFVEFILYLDTLLNQQARKKYNPKKHGGMSLFINPNDFGDYLELADGEWMYFPPRSFCFMAGDLAHSGSDNFQHKSGIIKIFVYIDPPKFNRRTHVDRDTVSLLENHKRCVVVWTATAPHRVVLHSLIRPYLCLQCTTSPNSTMTSGLLYYCYPYCKSCLLQKHSMAITCEIPFSKDKENRSDGVYSVVHAGVSKITVGHILSATVIGNLMSVETYIRTYKLCCDEVIEAVALHNTVSCEATNIVFEYLSFRSFLACMKQSCVLSECNVELFWPECEEFGRLRIIKEVEPGDEFVLFNSLRATPSQLKIEFDGFAASYFMDDIKEL